MSTNKNLIAVALSVLLGSMIVTLYPQRKQILNAIAQKGSELKEQSQDFADDMVRRGLALAHLERLKEHNGMRAGMRTLSWQSGLAGLLLGSGAALMLAPKTGRETRKQVKKLYWKLFGKTQTLIHDLSNSTSPFINTIYPIEKPRRKGVRRRSMMRKLK